MFLFIIQVFLGVFSPAFAADPTPSEEKTLAFIVGVGEFDGERERQLKDSAISAVKKAEGAAESLKGRVDKVDLLTSPEETTCANIKSELNQVAYEGYTHVIVIWFGTGIKELTTGFKNPATGRIKRVFGPKEPRFACSDLRLEGRTGEGYPFLANTSIDLRELARLTEKVSRRQTILIETRGQWSLHPSRSENIPEDETISGKGVTAADWPRQDNAVIISSLGLTEFALSFVTTLRDNPGMISLNSLVEKLAEKNGFNDDGVIIPMPPAVYGANIDPFWEFVRPAKREVPVLKPDPMDVKPPVVIKDPDPPVVKPKSKKLWAISLGVGSGFVASAVVTGIVAGSAFDKLNNHPDEITSLEEWNATTSRYQTFAPLTAGLGSIGVVGLGVGSAGIVFKW
jgi:hypothetical protein